jgi:hypothetical protein
MPQSFPQSLRSCTGIRGRLLTLLAILLLAGCNSGGGGTSAAPTSSSTGGSSGSSGGSTVPATSTVVFSGSVGDGPVTGASVQIYSSSWVLLGTTVTDSSAGYHASIEVQDGDYPLRLQVSNGVDLVTGTSPDYTLASLLQSPTDQTANINPFTTLIAKVAERMSGGLTAKNLSSARNVVLAQTGFGLDTSQVANPFTTVIGNTNAAQLVRASEALGEWIRRVRDLSGSSAGTVLNALAADLTDGYLDGLGATGINPRLSAIANVVAAQVLVETLGNHLRVGGVEATSVMDQALRSTHPGISSTQLTASVRVTARLITQARIAVAAAEVLDSSSTVQALASTLAGLTAGSTSASVSTMLPADSTDSLRSAVLLAPGVSSTELTTINQMVFASLDSGTTSPGAPPPTTPAGSLVLAWTAPTLRTDGSPLSLADISGYRIYYGSAHGSYPTRVNVTDPTATTTTVPNLVAGATYFGVMTTVDNAGQESGHSAEFSKAAQ